MQAKSNREKELESKIVWVLNGYVGEPEEKREGIYIHPNFPLITPGDLEMGYSLRLTSADHHLEELTSKQRISPLSDLQKHPLKWHKYLAITIPNMIFAPLQKNFQFSLFVDNLLKKKTGWELLTEQPHDVLGEGLLVIRKDNQIQVLQGTVLKAYLEQFATKLSEGEQALFFCDKKLGKIKPLSKIYFSDIYSVLMQIQEFKNADMQIIMVTSSASKKNTTSVIMNMHLQPLDMQTLQFELRTEDNALLRSLGTRPPFVKAIQHPTDSRKNILQILGSTYDHFIAEVKKDIGPFFDYHVSKNNDSYMHGKKIDFMSKPGQQVLTSLNCKTDKSAKLSEKKDGSLLRVDDVIADVIIKRFDKVEGELIIPKSCLKQAIKSAKVTINPYVFSKNIYSTIVLAGFLHEQTALKFPLTEISLQFMATGVCLFTEVVPLVKPKLTSEGKTIFEPRTGIVDVNKPLLGTISLPGLNMRYGQAKDKNEKLAAEGIKNMYRLAIGDAITKGYEMIIFPAIGLGAFGGIPELYFRALFEVAKEFQKNYPSFLIFYNFGNPNNANVFNDLFAQFQPKNVKCIEEDILGFALWLLEKNIPPVIVNPSDADVLLGIYDPGEYWKDGNYVAEEHFASLTTLAMAGRGLRPDIYKEDNILESSFCMPCQQVIDNIIENKKFSLQENRVKLEQLKKSKDELNQELKNGFSLKLERMVKDLDEEITLIDLVMGNEKEINMLEVRVIETTDLIRALTKELHYFGFFKNKELKKEKIAGLGTLLNLIIVGTPAEKAVEKALEKHPELLRGGENSRVAHFLKQLCPNPDLFITAPTKGIKY